MDEKQTKAFISAAIILLAAVLTVVSTMSVSNDSSYYRSSNGIAVDYGSWDVEWNEIPLGDKTIRSALDELTIEWDGDKIVSVNGHECGDNSSWDVWVVSKGNSVLQKIPSGSYSMKASSFTAISLALTEEGCKPARVVDALGNSILGYKNALRTVTTSPSISEFVCSFGAVDTIVGCDTATNYPSELVSRIGSQVSYIGDMMTISFEKIVGLNPDMVIIDSSVTSQNDVAKKILSTTSIGCVVLFRGNEPSTVLDNAFLVGTALGQDYKEITAEKISFYKTAYDLLKNKVSDASNSPKGALILYDKVYASFTCGTDSIFNNVLVDLKGSSALQLKDNWFTFNDEQFLNSNPDFIVIINPYEAFTSWDEMMSDIQSRHPLWADTEAFKKGNIYLVSNHASDIFQRICPRYIEMAEVLAKWTQPDLFKGDKVVPKFIGNGYEIYLDYTKEEQ